MFTVRLAPGMLETGWIFDTKEAAEDFMRIHNFIKVSGDKWINSSSGGSETSGRNETWTLLVVEENE